MIGRVQVLFCLVSIMGKSPSEGAAAMTKQSGHIVPHGSSMGSTYDKLAEKAVETLRRNNNNGDNGTGSGGGGVGGRRNNTQLWIGLGGAPGSGKTTVAHAVARRIRALNVDVIVLPMDGYHYTKAEMLERKYDMTRRGAPWTFDAEAMAKDLTLARNSGDDGDEVIKFPEYSRDISDPIPNKIQLLPNDEVVIVEGLYVLLGLLPLLPSDDQASARGGKSVAVPEDIAHITLDGGPRSVDEEVRRWGPITDLFDETWFVSPPAEGGDSFDENRRRLVERSLQTWTAEKTQLWGGGDDREAATRRVEHNDMKNGKLILCCRPFADVQIDSI